MSTEELTEERRLLMEDADAVLLPLFEGLYGAWLVWRFGDAPEELQRLSENGGDEDWILVLPPKDAKEWVGWADSGGSFGCFSVDEYVLPSGVGIRIGSHS